MSDLRYDTYCGLYCGACELLTHTRNGKNQNGAKGLICSGCKGDTPSKYTNGCDIRKCAHGKGVDFCFECDDHPCQVINEFCGSGDPHHSSILDNLKALKHIGLEEWLEQQRERWCCKNCGTPFSWYDENCDKCGASHYNSLKEEKDIDDKPDGSKNDAFK